MYFGSCLIQGFRRPSVRAIVLILYLLHNYYFEKLFDSFTRLEVDSDIMYRDAVFLRLIHKDLLNGAFGEIQSPQLSKQLGS
jgi:hypothetical protein